ncbi:MAG TPA: LysR substrate-binding domain-containing protein [Solirubrobacteraceae bacterium]|nr:LysR substrate-binding domain-containing protein [Solirubrobacteraceae bacterium]
MTDLRRLQYFVAVARERNFTRAAGRLHIAQPALSRQVRLLEQELGVELLHRTTHQFELTQAGEFLLARGPEVLSAADELWRSVRTYGTGDRAELVVGYGASASYETGPRLLARLADLHPGISIAASVRSTGEIVAGVGDGSIDLGLVRCPPRTAELDTRVIRFERQVVLLRRDHRLASQDSVGVAELAEETFLLHPREANRGHYDAVLELCRKHGVEPKVALRALTFDLRYSPIVENGAVSIIGESTTSGLPEELSWVALEPPACFEVSLIARRHSRSPAVGRVLDSAVVISADLGWI